MCSVCAWHIVLRIYFYAAVWCGVWALLVRCADIFGIDESCVYNTNTLPCAGKAPLNESGAHVCWTMPDSMLCIDDRARNPVFSTAVTVTTLYVCVWYFCRCFQWKREKTEMNRSDLLLEALSEADSGVRTGETEPYNESKCCKSGTRP